MTTNTKDKRDRQKKKMKKKEGRLTPVARVFATTAHESIMLMLLAVVLLLLCSKADIIIL